MRGISLSLKLRGTGYSLYTGLELTLTPDDVTFTEGSNANIACSPLLQGIISIVFRTIAPGAFESEAVMENKLTVTYISSVRIFTFLNASENDDGRKFFCWFGAKTSNIAALYVNCEFIERRS